MLKPAGIVVVLVGLLLLASSFAYPFLMPDQALRSNEDALAYAEAAGQYHAETFAGDSNREPTPQDNPALVAAREQYQREKAKLDQDRAERHLIPGRLWYAGVGVTALGIVALLTAQGLAKDR